MRNIILFALFTFAVAEEIDYFVTGNEHLDMDALIADHDELQAYLNCFLDKGPCTELTESYKKVARGSVEDACKRCTDNQKYMYRRFLEGVKQIYPEQYEELKLYYDPEHKYYQALEKEISRYLKPVLD